MLQKNIKFKTNEKRIDNIKDGKTKVFTLEEVVTQFGIK